MANNTLDPSVNYPPGTLMDPSLVASYNSPLQYDNSGKPILPGYIPLGKYNGITDSKGNLGSQYKTPTFDQVSMDPTALNAIKEEALGTGSSPWAQMLRLQQQQGQETALDQNAQSSASSRAQALADMSRLGGMSSGASENLARQSQKNALLSDNAIRRQGMSDVTNIGLSDAQMKNQMLMQIPGMEMQKANLSLQNDQLANNVNQFNIGNAINDKKNLNTWTAQDIAGNNAYLSNAYSAAMQGWGAGKDADARMAQANNSGGSWLCTEANKICHFEKEKKKTLSKFLRQAMKLDPETVRFYLCRCQPLIDKMKEKGANWTHNASFVLEIIKLMGEEKIGEALALYCDYTISCIEKYWPECRDKSYFRIREIRKQELRQKGA